MSSKVPVTSWFTVGHERLPGKSYKWTANGQVVKTVNHSDLKSPYDIPLHAFRWPLQFETKGTSQTNDLIMLVDWWTIWQLKA